MWTCVCWTCERQECVSVPMWVEESNVFRKKQCRFLCETQVISYTVLYSQLTLRTAHEPVTTAHTLDTHTPTHTLDTHTPTHTLDTNTPTHILSTHVRHVLNTQTSVRKNAKLSPLHLYILCTVPIKSLYFFSLCYAML